MTFRKGLGILHFVLVGGFIAYQGHKFGDGKVIPCAEMLACRDPASSIAKDFDPALCKTENYCSNRSGKVRTSEEYDEYNRNQVFFWLLFASIAIRLIISRSMKS